MIALADMGEVRILVVEDEEDQRKALTAELEARGYLVSGVADARTAIQAIAATSFKLILLDRLLPNGDGLDLLRWLRTHSVTIPVILLTALARLEERLEGLEAGADDYVVKPFAIEELHARIRMLLRRNSPAQAEGPILTCGDITVSLARHRVTRAGQPIDMPRVEMLLLAALIRGADTVLTRPLLIESVWGHGVTPVTNIVDVHVGRLRKHLATSGLPDPIVTVRGLGYMLRA